MTAAPVRTLAGGRIIVTSSGQCAQVAVFEHRSNAASKAVSAGRFLPHPMRSHHRPTLALCGAARERRPRELS